jgi:hypothetical protein
LKRTSTAIDFLFFIFDHEYLIRVQSSEPIHAKMNPTSCLFGTWFACAQTSIFSAKPSSKNVVETSISRNQNQKGAALWWILRQIKVRQPIERQDSMQTVIKLWSGGFIFARVAQNFEVFSNIQE